MAIVIGAGLAGCEAALYLANNGIKVELFEQKPRLTAAHSSENFAELVCSNSFKAKRISSASGLLKQELRILGSSLIPIAETVTVAAGGALAVDRELFSRAVTNAVLANKNIKVSRQEVVQIPQNEPVIIASGPLTSDALAVDIAAHTGAQNLYFHDAAAPIVTLESLNSEHFFKAARYNRGEPDYINCPMNKAEYTDFWQALCSAETAELHSVDRIKVYEGCMPIEVLAKRGEDALRFGPMKPVGLRDPKTGSRSYANIQLRKEDEQGRLYNIVGFQTNLKFAEQKKVFSKIAALETADFARYGVMHRNSFINSPQLLNKTLNLKTDSNIYFAGQLTGFEGYTESMLSGVLAARFLLAQLKGEKTLNLSSRTMSGALLNYITSKNSNFQPMGANMGILEPLEAREKSKELRYEMLAKRAIDEINNNLSEVTI